MFTLSPKKTLILIAEFITKHRLLRHYEVLSVESIRKGKKLRNIGYSGILTSIQRR